MNIPSTRITVNLNISIKRIPAVLLRVKSGTKREDLNLDPGAIPEIKTSWVFSILSLQSLKFLLGKIKTQKNNPAQNPTQVSSMGLTPREIFLGLHQKSDEEFPT